jgi:hypothetical protein
MIIEPKQISATLENTNTVILSASGRNYLQLNYIRLVSGDFPAASVSLKFYDDSSSASAPLFNGSLPANSYLNFHIFALEPGDRLEGSADSSDIDVIVQYDSIALKEDWDNADWDNINWQII